MRKTQPTIVGFEEAGVKRLEEGEHPLKNMAASLAVRNDRETYLIQSVQKIMHPYQYLISACVRFLVY